MKSQSATEKTSHFNSISESRLLGAPQAAFAWRDLLAQFYIELVYKPSFGTFHGKKINRKYCSVHTKKSVNIKVRNIKLFALKRKEKFEIGYHSQFDFRV